MYKFLYALLLVFVAMQLSAQGTVVLQEESGVRRLLDIRRSNNFKKDRTLRAWSVQILISRDKYEVIQKTQEVRSIFRDDVQLKIDWTYEQPYYRLNAGAFYTKMECASLLYRLMQRYPDAYIFKNDKVKSTDF